MVHIGEDVWLIGRDSIVEGRKHQVVYGPGRKEYHLWDRDVDFVNLVMDKEHDELRKSNIDRHGNTSLEHRVKVYILTSILDERKNWCFNLNEKPEIGKRVKVIYSNGTVKWVESFDGEFKDAELISKRSSYKYDTDTYPKQSMERTSLRIVSPLGYRKW